MNGRENVDLYNQESEEYKTSVASAGGHWHEELRYNGNQEQDASIVPEVECLHGNSYRSCQLILCNCS